MSAGLALLSRVWRELDGESRTLDGVAEPTTAVPLPSRLATGRLAWASIGAATLAAGRNPSMLDAGRIATAYRSDRVLTIDGTAPPVWAALSGFWQTADGWIRTHANYPHHAAGLRAGLRLGDTAEAADVRDALAVRTSAAAIEAISAEGGLAVAVMAEHPALDAALRQTPLLDVRGYDSPAAPRAVLLGSASRPLEGIRILDLTRVIAGPVCTRTLALLGADVLRVDPPGLLEPEWQHLDTGHGKRSTLLDARSARFDELLAEADAVVLGYRPAALARLGLDPQSLVPRHPGLVVAQLSAWGADHPQRAGFDSLVQAESGIALIESPDGERPGALPAQALDHSAGYLLAAAITMLLRRRAIEGGSWWVQTSLRRVAAELLGMPRRAEPGAEVAVDPAAHIAHFSIGDVELVTAKPALPGLEFAAPRTWGADQPSW
ncbi:CoA transferase [Microbacterium luteolum]|nr:CoA transferase [Microbacterium luteolum]